MRSVVPVLLLTLATLSTAAERRRNPLKPAEIQIVEISARRGEGRISLDGRVKNAGERSASRVVLIFDFMAPGRQVIVTRKGELEADVLEPGDEAEFHVYVPEPARVVEVRVQAEDGGGRELKVSRGGPHPVE